MSPTDTQNFENNWIKSYEAGAQQPAANLQSTETSTEATAEQAQIQELQLKQQQFNNDTQQTFANIAKENNGYVPPDIYNKALGQAQGLSIDTSKGFFDNYVDPTQLIKYNNNNGQLAKAQRSNIVNSIVPQINDILDQYDKLSGTGPFAGIFTNKPITSSGITSQLLGGLENIPSGIASFFGFAGPQDVYESNRNDVVNKIGDLAKTDTTGLNLSATDISRIGNNIPEVGDNSETVKQKLSNLQDIVKNMTGKGLDAKLLDKYGVDTPESTPSLTGSDVLDKVLSGAGNDINTLVSQFISGASQYAMPGLSSLVTNPGNPVSSATDFISNLGQTTGIGQNGKLIDLEEALNHAENHPLLTYMTLAGLKGGIPTEEASTGEPPTEDPPPGGQQNPLLKLLNNTTDLLKGGGSKDYIARTADMENPVSQSQVLNEEGILSHPTETGRIQATQEALTKYGSSLDNIYSQSDRFISGDDLSKSIMEKLQENGVPTDDAQKIISRITTDIRSQGFFNMALGDEVIPMKSLWQCARWLEKYNPIIPKDPDATAYLKENADTISQTMRQELNAKVPEAKPYAARYGALRDYFDNTLKNPTGANLKQGVIRSTMAAVQDSGDVVDNILYKLLGGKGLPQVNQK